ncbi:STN domain-containing protein [Odoribacter splanchnicus]|nr:STN domain-containing protein [Odoribacter splanchnicus]
MKKSRWCFQVPRGYWRKSWKIARMFSVLMCTLTFSVSATAFAQHEQVTLNFKQVTVRQVLNEIQRQTRLSFIYNTEQTEQLGQISVEAHNESVTSLLDRILAGTGLTWKIQEDMILIS